MRKEAEELDRGQDLQNPVSHANGFRLDTKSSTTGRFYRGE